MGQHKINIDSVSRVCWGGTNINVYSREVVFRYRDTRLEVGEHYSNV